jgi:predicted hydrocarbon binding protein
MKRKLISFDVFKKIEEASLTKAQNELIAAEEVLSKTLGVEDLKLFTFGESDVNYQAPDGTFIHAVYSLDKEQLVLENIEQFVIEESSEEIASRDLLDKFVDSLLEDNQARAEQQFEQYINSSIYKRQVNMTEAKESKSKKEERKNKFLAFLASKGKLHGKKKGHKKPGKMYAKKMKQSMVKEWVGLCENVYGYLEFKSFGPIAAQSRVKLDQKGNITGIAMPTLEKRNEAKVLSFDWKCTDAESTVLRAKGKKLSENQNFVKMMADLKRYNNVVDNVALEETLEAVVTKWPSVLYVTETELATQIRECLEIANVTNFDDEMCQFMAEAILRTAHNTHVEKVQKIAKFAGATHDVSPTCESCDDAYLEFQMLVDDYFLKLDETTESELQVVADIYRAMHEIHRMSLESGDEMTKSHAESFLSECASMLNKESVIDLAVIEEMTHYLADFLESNMPMASADGWDATNSNVHHTMNGAHPHLDWIAKQTDATASKYNGDFDGISPTSDGKIYSKALSAELKDHGWGNMGDDNTYPSLSNPYNLKNADYKMKEKSVIDDNEDWGLWQSEDTWPNLKNPYVPHKKG